MKWLGVLMLACALPASAAVHKGSTVRITLQNGTIVMGEVVSETSQGLLIMNGKQTELVPFASFKTVDDLTPSSEAPPPAPPPADPMQPPAPPPLVDDAPLPPKRAANFREERRYRFGAGVSAGAAPSYYGVAWGVGAEGVLAFELSERWSLRVIANYTHTQNGPYSTNLVLAIAMPTVWFGWYGLGVAAALGCGDITRQGFGLAIGVLASPIRVRFGEKLTHDLSLDLGTILITSDGRFDPFGRISYTLFF